jgi:predicted Fe-Mo cluster-binding NifX family protein
MKAAVCSTGNTLDSPIDPRFGRCANFVVVDTETFDASAVPNPGAMSAQGAGIQAAQVVSSLGASAVIAGNFGPNAFQALSAAGIEVYTGARGTVRDAINQFNSGQLQAISAASVAAHFGMGATPGQGPGMGMGGGTGATPGQGPGMGMGGGMGRGRGMGRRGGSGRGRGGR